ncbi:MAG: hypothetical protein IID48_18780 [Proteobacteria bacterium]|nr:hypothetical protein [Pseudomonadota bacterium]
MTAQLIVNGNLHWNWGVPDWRDERAYLATHDLTVRQWRWEFMRRRPVYRGDWVRWFWQKRDYVEKNEATLRRDHLLVGLDWSKDKALETVMPDDFIERCLKGASGWIKDPSRQFSDWQLQHGIGYKLPKERRGPPKRARPRLPREDTAARQKQYYESGDWYFDLTQPLPPQFANAKAYLARIQKELYGKQNTPKPRRALWPLYLRALDAKDAGASYDLMARTFWPSDFDKKTPQSARDVYEAAVVLRTNFPF